MGRSIGLFTLLGIGIAALILGRRIRRGVMTGFRIRSRETARSQPQPLPAASVPDSSTRMRDVITRARMIDLEPPAAN